MIDKCNIKVLISIPYEEEIDGIGICGDTNIFGIPHYCIKCTQRIYGLTLEEVYTNTITQEAEDKINS